MRTEQVDSKAELKMDMLRHEMEKTFENFMEGLLSHNYNTIMGFEDKELEVLVKQDVAKLIEQLKESLRLARLA